VSQCSDFRCFHRSSPSPYRERACRDPRDRRRVPAALRTGRTEDRSEIMRYLVYTKLFLCGRITRQELTALIDKDQIAARHWAMIHACSRITSSAFLLVRSPRKAGCRISPSLVHSVNFTSATSFGISHVVSLSCFTFWSNGFLAASKGRIFS
jgi:hypothetical protein